MSSLRKKTVQSGLIVTITSIAAKIITIVTTIILARLLEPGDFGIVSLAGLFIGITELFSSFGMRPALLSTRYEIYHASFHAAVLTLASGLILSSIVFLMSEKVALVFGNEILKEILHWMAIIIVIDSLSIVPQTLLEKDFLYYKILIPKILSSFIYMVIAIILAIGGFGVWSLVVGKIITSCTKFIGFTLLCPDIKLIFCQKWNTSIVKSIGKYGITSMGAGLIRYTYNNVDDLIIGRVYNVTELGFYTYAYNLSNIPIDNISKVINTVLLPAYSKIKDDKNKITEAFLESLQAVSFLIIPLSVVIFIFAHDFIIIFLGEKWQKSIVLIQIFSILSLIRPLSGTTSPIFYALGFPEFNLRISILQLLSMLFFIWMFISKGAPGVAIAVCISFFIGLIYNIFLLCFKLGLHIEIKKLFITVSPILFCSFIMVVFLMPVKIYFPLIIGDKMLELIRLGILLLLAVTIYMISVLVVKRDIITKIFDLFVSKKVKNKFNLKFNSFVKELNFDYARVLIKKKLRFVSFKNSKSHKYPIITGIPASLNSHDLLRHSEFLHELKLKNISHQHLSGWKDSGAYRLLIKNEIENNRMIYKNSIYRYYEIGALKGLKLNPGPPEFIIYKNAKDKLRRFLPEIYFAKEIIKNKHYQYLMEDVSIEYNFCKNSDKIPFLCKKLPEIHSALSEFKNYEQKNSLLEYNKKFAYHLINYSKASLKKLAEIDKAQIVQEIMYLWPELSKVYFIYADKIYTDQKSIQPIHGDLNTTNIFINKYVFNQLKIIDWEWAGFGLRQSDLASLLKKITPEQEMECLNIYNNSSNCLSFEEDRILYYWCKLQRGIFDAGFYAKQFYDKKNTTIKIEKHITKAIKRSLIALQQLKKVTRN